MREILFRGKKIGYDKWEYGSLFISETDNTAFIESGGSYTKDEVQVDEKTVGQFTGLLDKNGTKIFDGDIVVCKQYICGNFVDCCIEKGFVEMKYGAYGLHRKQGYYRPFKDWLEDYEYEIIGNIYDNPELLQT